MQMRFDVWALCLFSSFWIQVAVALRLLSCVDGLIALAWEYDNMTPF
jgi:hypothetical protein